MLPERSVASPLTLEEVIPFLLECGVLEKRLLVDDDVSAGELGGLNTNFYVFSQRGPCFFVKQYRGTGARRAARSGVEMEIYRGVGHGQWLAPLLPYLPPLLVADPERQLMVLEYVSAGSVVEDEPDEEGREGEEPSNDPLALPPVAQGLGRALAALHGIALAPAEGSPPAARLGRDVPWALSLARPSVELLMELTMAQLELLRILQSNVAVCDALDDLRRAWTPTAIIHSDLKWSNIVPRTGTEGGDVADPGAGPRAAAEVVLIDWELARFGDPAWDVGSVFHSYLARCVSAAPLAESNAEAATAAMAAHFPKAQEEIGKFWSAYRSATGATPPYAGFLDRAARMCGVRLFQSAYEWSQDRPRLSRAALVLLQLGVNLMLMDATERRTVLGLTKAPEI